MIASLFLRTGTILLIVGMCLGTYMGATHDFAQTGTHAHLNLAGGVLMILAGLFYNAYPNVPARLKTIHYALHCLGVALLVPGIAGSILETAWAPPVVGIGSILTLASGVFFAVMVFIGTGRKA